MKGKRAAAVRYEGRHLERKKRYAGYQAARPGNRAVIRLVICGVIFVVLVALKLLFPESVAGLARSASRLIGGDADFREAFAAVGRAVSGEEPVGDSLQEAYTAVFHPSPLSADAQQCGNASTEERSAEAVLGILDLQIAGSEMSFEPEAAFSLSEKTGTSVEEQAEEELTSEAASYVCVIPVPPENASMEQRSLGFDYVSPVRGKLTSSFGWREHPVTGGIRFHYGVDLAADTGTDICAFADGEVYATGESSTLGKYIILSHAGGYKTLYAHCSAVTVKSGAVTMGACIAKVGETGTTTGPHLHFELHSGALYLNPIYYVEIG